MRLPAERWGAFFCKIFGQAFYKRLAVSKGSAFGRLPQQAKFLIPEGAPKGVELRRRPSVVVSARGGTLQERVPPFLRVFLVFLSPNR